jgi:hypothetical protein
MFRAIFATQWKWTRGVVLPAALLTFALPILSMRFSARALAEMNARSLLAGIQSFGIFYGLSAALIGFLIAAVAWTPDHAGRHVYALSLPVERWKYVAMRFAAGAATLAAPVFTMLLGAFIAVSMVDLPPGLRTHPIALVIRFALASLLAYGVFFSVSSGTKRTAGVILGLLAALMLSEIVFDAVGVHFSPFLWMIDLVMSGPGTFGVFNSRWMLIDV